jgi:predicted Fe-S protein YdhL (DUF1289 family)
MYYTGNVIKIDEYSNWKSLNKEEGRKHYRRLRNELKRPTDKAKKQKNTFP